MVAQAAQLGAHIIKVKLPTEHVERPCAKKVYEQYEIPIKTITDRVRHVVQSVFDGRRVVIFSGGPREEDDAVFAEARAIRDGGGVRLDHRPELVPASQAGRAAVPTRDHADLRRGRRRARARMNWTVYWFMFPACIVISSIAMLSGISGATMLSPTIILVFPLYNLNLEVAVACIGVGVDKVLSLSIASAS